MKYPGKAPIGRSSADASPAWRAAGHDLVAAESLARTALGLADDQRRAVAALELAEVLRRAGQPAEAGRALGEAWRHTDDDHSRVLVRLGVGYLRWWTPSAERDYQAVADAGQQMRDRIIEGLGLLGVARCSRFSAVQLRSDLLDRATFLLGDDEDALADVRRECAAHALMRNERSAAAEYAAAALETHERRGDEVLSALAQLLIGRSSRDHESTAVDIVRGAYRRALAAGALEIAADIATWLVPTLGRGATPDLPVWQEAMDLADHALRVKTSSGDDFGVAELRMARGRLKILTDPDSAERDVRAALAYFSAIGNQVGIGSATKDLGRIRVRRANAVWIGSRLRGIPAASRDVPLALAWFARSRRAFAAAAVREPEARAGIEAALVGLSELGAPLGEEPLRQLASLADSKDDVTTARLHLLRGITSLDRKPNRASKHFRSALEIAERNDNTQLQAISWAAIAVAERAAGHPLAASRAASNFVDRAERIRLAVLDPLGSIGLARLAAAPYRFALDLATEAGDARLALRVLERLRSERLSALFRRTGPSPGDPRIQHIIEAIDAIESALPADPSTEGTLSESRSWPREDHAPGQPTGNRAELLGELETLTNEMFMSIWTPERFDLDKIIDAVRQDGFVLVQELDPVHPDRLTSVWRDDQQSWHVDRAELPRATLDLIEILNDRGSGAASRLRVQDLGPLQALVPEGLRVRLLSARSSRSESGLPLLRIVPSGVLWAVPYLAVPLDGRVLLIDRTDVVLSPSLRLHAIGARRPIAASHANDKDPLVWTSLPVLDAARILRPLHRHGQGATPIRDVDTFLESLQAGRHKLAVLLGHGDARPGLLHGMPGSDSSSINAGRVLQLSHVPPVVVLAACHGLFTPGDDEGEPIGLPTALLSSGARCVIGSHQELSTPSDTVELLGRVEVDILNGGDPVVVLNREVRDHLANRNGETPISYAAALNVLAVGNTGPLTVE